MLQGGPIDTRTLLWMATRCAWMSHGQLLAHQHRALQAIAACEGRCAACCFGLARLVRVRDLLGVDPHTLA